MNVRRLKAKMRERELDAFVAIQNAHYLSGTSAASVVIVARRKSILLCSRMELDRARWQSSIGDVQAYAPRRVPLRRGERASVGKLEQVIARCLKKLKAKKIGFDELKPETLTKIRSTHEASYHKLPELVWDLREIKTKKEIKWLRKSAEMARRGMERAGELIEEGRSELEIAAEVEYEMRRSGSEGTPFGTIVASGKNSWLPHAGATGKRLRRGDLVIVDLGATYRGYASDMSRTFALRPTRRQRDLIRVAKRAQRVALARVRGGTRAAKVDKAAREAFRRARYERFCLHGSGHGVGLGVHEPPSLSVWSDDVLRKGMVITVEPGVYVRGVGGARFEDMVVVTRGGYRPLTLV